MTYLTEEELEGLAAEPDQTLAQWQGTFECKICTFNMGYTQHSKDKKKLDTAGGHAIIIHDRASSFIIISRHPS